MSYQVERQALGGILQGQVLQLVQALVQAHAHVAQQVQAGVGVLLQMAQHQLVGKAYEANRLQGLGTYRQYRTLHEHDGFGEGVARGNDLDDALLAVSGNAVELDLATLHQREALGRIALALDQALWRVLPYLGIGQQFLLCLPLERRRPRMTRNQLALCRWRDRGCTSFAEVGAGPPAFCRSPNTS